MWRGTFGDAYTKRNAVNRAKVVRARARFFKGLMGSPEDMVTELGCGDGKNLEALKKAGYYGWGYEVNGSAVKEARKHGGNVGHSDVTEMYSLPRDGTILTVGFLIHLDPVTLYALLNKVKSAAKRVVMVEYYAKEWTPVTYRGLRGVLWKGDYGRIFETVGSHATWKQVRKGIAPKCFDRCRYWVYERVDA
jgi:hypothetical protein